MNGSHFNANDFATVLGAEPIGWHIILTCVYVVAAAYLVFAFLKNALLLRVAICRNEEAARTRLRGNLRHARRISAFSLAIGLCWSLHDGIAVLHTLAMVQGPSSAPMMALGISQALRPLLCAAWMSAFSAGMDVLFETCLRLRSAVGVAPSLCAKKVGLATNAEPTKP